jgi:hypothetical protein
MYEMVGGVEYWEVEIRYGRRAAMYDDTITQVVGPCPEFPNEEAANTWARGFREVAEVMGVGHEIVDIKVRRSRKQCHQPTAVEVIRKQIMPKLEEFGRKDSAAGYPTAVP